MSIKHTTNQIYLSYAYVDNQNFVDNDRAWISAFQDDLETELSFALGKILPITIFHDKQFNSPSLLTVKYIRNANIFIVIGTPAYFLSDYCEKELKLFLKREDINPYQNLFLVDKKPFEDAALQASIPVENYFPFFDMADKKEWNRKDASDKYFGQITQLAHQIKKKQ